MTQALQGRDIETATLSNGIRVVTERMPHVRSVAVGVWVGSGSRRESGAECGISHFLEHMLFKGTARRGAEEIAREVDSIGGHLDAFTGKELVGFNTKVLDEHLAIAVDILADLVLHPRFDPADIEKEKGVVLEELKMEMDNPEYQVHEIFTSHFWKGHGLGAPILGTRKTIQGFSRELLTSYHARVYSPSNLLLTAAGNLEHARLVALVEDHFGHHPAGQPLPPDSSPAPQAAVNIKKKRLQQVQLCLGVPSLPMADPNRYAGFVLNTLLGGGMSSRLFQNIRERQGLAYSVYSELTSYRDAGCLAVYAGTSADALPKVLDSVVHEFRSIVNDGIPAEELRRAKDNLKGSLMLSLESTSSRMANLARQQLYYQRFFTMDEMLNSIERVEAATVQDLARQYFRTEAISIAALGPIEGFVPDREQLAI